MRRVIVRAEARRDIREARAWYSAISPSLARDFIIAVERATTLAAEHPLAFQIAHRSFRRILLRRFPYALFYHATAERIVIVAVLHQARDPEALTGR